MVISVMDELMKYYIFTVPTQDNLGFDYYALKSNEKDYTLEKIPNIIDFLNRKHLKIDEIYKEDKSYLDYINGLSYALVKLLKNQNASKMINNNLIYYANGKINYMPDDGLFENNQRIAKLNYYEREERSKAEENLIIYMLDQINDYNEILINNKRSK